MTQDQIIKLYTKQILLAYRCAMGGFSTRNHQMFEFMQSIPNEGDLVLMHHHFHKVPTDTIGWFVHTTLDDNKCKQYTIERAFGSNIGSPIRWENVEMLRVVGDYNILNGVIEPIRKA